MEKPELALKKLRRLESNMKCPNCGTPAPPGIGFGNMCIKYKTFICDLCKTSHQAISHRVKSFSMSAWTMDEVMELTLERNGGNFVALHVWLANAPPPGGKYPGGFRPKEGDKVEIFKQFVTDCYEHGKFRANSPFDASTASEDTSTLHSKSKTGSIPSTPVRVVSREAATTPCTQRRQQSLPVQPAQEVDLLAFDSNDFGEFCNTPPQPTFDAFQPEPTVNNNYNPNSFAPAAVTGDKFLCDFSDFTSAAPSVPTFAPPPPPLDLFGSTATTTINVTKNNPLLQPYGQTPTVSHNTSFDPFLNTIHNSVSMPSFPTVPTEPVFQSATSTGQGQSSRTKSNLDLAALYDQKLPQTNNSNSSQSFLGMGQMGLHSSSDAISGIDCTMIYRQGQGSSSSYSNNQLPHQQHQPQFQQMNGYHNNGSINMIPNMATAAAGNMGGGWNNSSAMSGNGIAHSQQNQTYNNNNSSNQQISQPYCPPQNTMSNMQKPQQVYRGITPIQSSVSKGPVDAFDFLGSTLMTQLKSKTGAQGGVHTCLPICI